ncbi:hypothetical protein D3C87_85380 [compost metagenome]
MTFKQYTIFTMSLLVVAIISMCLPYEHFDRALGDPGSRYRDGFYFFGITCISPLAIVLLWALVVVFNNLAMAIVSLILSVFHLFYVFALGLLLSLDLSFFGPPVNSYPGIGYFILVLVALAHIVLTSVHIYVYTRRARENRTYLQSKTYLN